MRQPVRLLIDGRFTRVDHPDGISRFTAGLVDALLAYPDRVRLLLLVSDPRQLDLLPQAPSVLGPSPLRPSEVCLARRLNRLRPDVVFCPMQTMGSWGRRYRLVLTLHDLIYYRYPTPPDHLPAYVRLLWRLFHRAYWPQRVLLHRADVVATVSQTTRALIACHRLTRRPVEVVGNAPPTASMPPADSVPGLQARGRRLVYMGAFTPYKNVETLLAAMAYLPGYELRLLSRIEARRRAELEALTPPGARVAFVGGVREEEYAAELDAAACLVNLSRAEGFGIPLVEAMGRGVPIVVGDTPIFREIGSAAARYVPLDDARSVAAAVRELEDPAVWARASAAGLQRAAHFSWDDSAKRLLAVVEALAQAP